MTVGHGDEGRVEMPQVVWQNGNVALGALDKNHLDESERKLWIGIISASLNYYYNRVRELDAKIVMYENNKNPC